jgi:hypothetical protein
VPALADQSFQACIAAAAIAGSLFSIWAEADTGAVYKTTYLGMTFLSRQGL